MRVADFIGGVVVLLLGLGIIFFAAQLEYSSEYGPGPGFLPLWLGIGIAGCAVVVLVNLVRKHGQVEAFIKPRTKEGVKILVFIIISLLLLPFLGFSIALALFAGVSMRAIGKHRWVVCGLTVIGIGIGIHVIFAQWLTIPLPKGFIGW